MGRATYLAPVPAGSTLASCAGICCRLCLIPLLALLLSQVSCGRVPTVSTLPFTFIFPSGGSACLFCGSVGHFILTLFAGVERNIGLLFNTLDETWTEYSFQGEINLEEHVVPFSDIPVNASSGNIALPFAQHPNFGAEVGTAAWAACVSEST